MLTQHQSRRRTNASEELRKRCPELDSAQVVDSLAAGLSHLRNLLITRIHEDVELHFTIDSMIAPVSRFEAERQARDAKVEIDVYSAIVLNEEVTQCQYVDCPEDWFLDWLFQLRLGEAHEAFLRQHVELYRSPTAEDRRLKFLSVLQRTVPESVRTPLVLFRLFPRAVRIVAAVAFGDPLRAQELRAEQCSFLPAVSDCSECHGRVLENDDICRVCGNPVWEFAWLQSD